MFLEYFSTVTMCNARLSARLWQRHHEGRSTRGIVLDRHRAAMCLDDPFRDAEPETIAACLLGSRAIYTKERFEEARHIAFWNARTIVGQPNHDVLAVL